MQEKKFEELLQELNSIVEALEKGELSLEESVEKYQQGLLISAECKNRLEAARAVVVKKMTPNGEVPFQN